MFDVTESASDGGSARREADPGVFFVTEIREVHRAAETNEFRERIVVVDGRNSPAKDMEILNVLDSCHRRGASQIADHAKATRSTRDDSALVLIIRNHPHPD